MEFNIGDKVITTDFADYDKNVPKGTCGTIVRIRYRYQDTPNAYNQYKVKFRDYSTDIGNTDNLYTKYNIKKIVDLPE